MTKATGFTKALPKNFKKVKSGYDQAFTLPKGTSAAPIKQSKVTGIKKSIIEGAVIGGAAVGGWELGKKTSEKKPITPLKKPKKKKNTKGRTRKFGGGRTDLIEELGRVEAEPSNRNRRAEISRVHGELNRGYKHGKRVGKSLGGAATHGFNTSILRNS